MTDPVFRCPGCGAAASIDSVRCEYCRVPLSTTNCTACFEPMFVGSRYCPHCGVVAAREVVPDVPPCACPRCKETLQALKLGSTSAQECGACGGLWVEPDTLQRLVDAKEEGAAVTSVLAARIPTAPQTASAVRYVPCPVCAKPMNRVNFAKASGVILDVCKLHGIWLDRGEMQAVLHFVESGGLTVARNREREQLVEEQRRVAALNGITGAAGTPRGSMSIGMPTPSWTDDAPASAHDLEKLFLNALGRLFL
jgi:Zn-finger nucleic acid-binding protein